MFRRAPLGHADTAQDAERKVTARDGLVSVTDLLHHHRSSWQLQGTQRSKRLKMSKNQLTEHRLSTGRERARLYRIRLDGSLLDARGQVLIGRVAHVAVVPVVGACTQCDTFVSLRATSRALRYLQQFGRCHECACVNTLRDACNTRPSRPAVTTGHITPFTLMPQDKRTLKI